MDKDQFLAIGQFLRCLTTAISTAGLYGADHPQALRLCQKALQELAGGMADKEELSLLRVDDRLAVERESLERTLSTDRFALLLKRREIGHLKFIRGVTADELKILAANLVGGQESPILPTAHIRLGQVEVRYRQEDSPAVAQSSGAADFHGALTQDDFARIAEVFDAVRRNRPLQVVGLTEIIAKFIDLFTCHADSFLAMVPLREMDEYTFTHSLNVCVLNLAQASSLGAKGEALKNIGLAAMLHDIGKLFVPLDILTKPGPLDDEEWALMRTHPVKGAEYLLGQTGVPRLAVINAYEHHLRYDLSGYPRLESGREQNPVSQMTTISDLYDALRTRRPYREPLSTELVLEQISNLKGTQLHPLLADNFIQLMCKVRPELLEGV